MSNPSENIDSDTAPESAPVEGVNESEIRLLPLTVDVTDSLTEAESNEKAKQASEIISKLAENSLETPPPYTVSLTDGDDQKPPEKSVQTTQGLQGNAVIL